VTTKDNISRPHSMAVIKSLWLASVTMKLTLFMLSGIKQESVKNTDKNMQCIDPICFSFRESVIFMRLHLFVLG